MALTERFKQIEPFVGKSQRAPHAAHLSWMQRFQERVQTLIVTELGEDCPAMITSQNTALVAAVQAEDEAYRTINRSLLDAQGNAVDATKKVDDTKQYQLEQPAEGGEVTPVTPE